MSEPSASQMNVQKSDNSEPIGAQRKPGEEMSDEDLLGLIRQYELASLGSQVAAGATISTTVYPSNQAMTTLEIDRYNALNAYFARPLGNEVENRSQVVLPELRDTIEWIMPQLMRIFMGTSSPVRFEAEGARDEESAKVETATVNHVFMHENNGFFVLHDFFKDAMLMRNGYVKVYWKESKQTSVSRYTGITEMELPDLLHESDNEKVDVLEQREYTIPNPMAPPPQPGQPQPPPLTVFDLKIRRTAKRGHVCVDCVPPEEMRVTPRAREGMEDLAFAMHMTNRPRSDLIADGYDRADVEVLSAGRPNWLDIDALARNQTVDQLSIENPADRAMQEIEVREVIMRVDYDGDGVAELRQVIVAGDKILENEVIEETPFASCVPKRMPHRHTGISLYDEIMDLQVIKSTLWRQGLDNLSISNNQRVAVDYQSANFDDLLTSRPGGVVRGKGPPANWIAAIQQPSNLTEQVLPALDYIDQQKMSRTGIGQAAMAVDPDELQNVTKGAHAQNLAQAALKTEMLARLLAEGVKPIFLKIRNILIRHQDQPLEFQVSGKWVNIDPQTWKPHRSNVQPNVGLGSGNRDEMRQNIVLLGQAIAGLKQMGLAVGPQQTYDFFKMACESLGFTSPERFAIDPATPAFAQFMHQQQQAAQSMPQPQVQAAKIKMQTTLGQEQAENAREKMKLDADQQLEKTKIVHDMLQSHNDRSADAAQSHKDREIDLDSNHMQLVTTLIKALAGVVSSQKLPPDQNAGAVLASDVETADKEIEAPDPMEKLHPILDGIHQALSAMNRPKTATLSDGRKITIQ